MANQEQLEILKSGVENWNRWREKNRLAKIDLVGDIPSIRTTFIGFQEYLYRGEAM